MSATENFADLFEQSLKATGCMEGVMLKGEVVSVERDMVLMDVGLKSEGYVPLREFSNEEQNTIQEGDIFDVFVERFENRQGEAVISRARARREEAWHHLEQAFEKGELFDGVVTARVRGGYTVDLDGATAFMPNSHADLRPVHDPQQMINLAGTFEILNMNRQRGTIVVSRRSVLERTREAQREKLLESIEEGQILDGTVKNITDFGAFVDLGGSDGLLHVTDISWKRIYHPSDVLNVGKKITVKIIKFNRETGRINLGIKQLTPNPWEGIQEKYPLQTVFEGTIRKIMEYGIFVDLEEGVAGLIHVSELSWERKPSLSEFHVGNPIEIKVMDIDTDNHRISLSRKRCLPNPWQAFADKHKEGDVVDVVAEEEGKQVLVVSLKEGIHGIMRLSDLDWHKSGDDAIKDFPKGTQTSAKILDINVEEEKILLGIKQLTDDPFKIATKGLKKGDHLNVTVDEVHEKELHVSFNKHGRGFIRKKELSLESDEQHTEQFKHGNVIEAMIINIDKKNKTVEFSVRELERMEHEQAMKKYGQKAPSVTLGDIIGNAQNKKK